MKLQNQLSDNSARSVVMVGLWGKVSGLLAEQEFEAKIKEGWSQGHQQTLVCHMALQRYCGGPVALRCP